MLNLLEAIKLGFQNCFNYKGRSTRSEFWWFMFFASSFQLILLGFLFVISFAPHVIDYLLLDNPGDLIVYLAWFAPRPSELWGNEDLRAICGFINLVFIIPIISLAVRRQHGINKPGWWVVPCVVVYLFLLRLQDYFLLGGLVPSVAVIAFAFFGIKPSQNYPRITPFCDQCGAEIPRTSSRFCPECGATIPPESPGEAQIPNGL